MQVSFSVPGAPRGKGRARSVQRGDRIVHVTPQKTVVYESTVALSAKRAMLLAGIKPVAGPVSLVVRCWFPVPKSWSKTKRQNALDGAVMPTCKPDIDNIVKSIADGCNNVVWLDDAGVVDLTCHKRYSDEPRVDVVVSWS